LFQPEGVALNPDRNLVRVAMDIETLILTVNLDPATNRVPLVHGKTQSLGVNLRGTALTRFLNPDVEFPAPPFPAKFAARHDIRHGPEVQTSENAVASPSVFRVWDTGPKPSDAASNAATGVSTSGGCNNSG